MIKFITILVSIFLLTSCNNTLNANKEEDKTTTEKNSTDIEMYVATDIHYISDKINDGGVAFQKMVETADGRQVNYIEEMVNAFVYDVQQNKPKVLIVSGDLTHQGEKVSHLDLAEKFKKIEESGTEVLVVPGNHDINNPYAREFKEDKQIVTDFVTEDEFAEIYSDYGYNEAFKRDENSLSYLATPTENVWVLMLDSSIYDNNEKYPATNGKIKDSTLQWIKECGELAKTENAQIVTVMHHNLYKHSQLLFNGFIIDNANEVQEVFKEYNLNIVLSGHIHIQSIVADESNKVFDIATSGFVVYPLQYGVLKFGENEFTYNTQLVNVEKWAKDFGSDNEDLLNFNEYSKNYFYNDSYNKVYNGLIGNNNEDDAKKMAHTMALLNINYFGGTTHMIAEEVVNSTGYKLWVESENGGFIKEYVLAMLEQGEKNHSYLKIMN